MMPPGLAEYVTTFGPSSTVTCGVGETSVAETGVVVVEVDALT